MVFQRDCVKYVTTLVALNVVPVVEQDRQAELRSRFDLTLPTIELDQTVFSRITEEEEVPLRCL